ncbi:MAG: class I SAM-dependent methyltransferase, partial [Planctomycetota bacterium]
MPLCRCAVDVDAENMQYTNCNICNMNETSLITIQNEYRVVRCNNCKLVYVNPRPTPAALIALYNDYHQRDDKDDQTWARLMDMNFRSAASFLSRVYPGKGKILDVGCGYGHFVDMMKNCGWAASGIETSSRTVGYAKSKGLDVTETTIDDAVFPENSFTAITAFYVLEHLFNPFSALKKMHDILKPGGALILRVPHTT